MNTKKEKIIAMIPVRMGSTRLPAKNLAILDGKPLISYAIKAARDSRVFDRIVVNSEDRIFAPIAASNGAEFYQRPVELGSSTAKSDTVVYDFMKNNPCDIMAWVNTTSPLQTGKDVRNAVGYFMKEALDSLITVKDEQVHCVYNSRPVNFKLDEIFAQTQDLVPVQGFVYSVMMWRTRPFMKMFEEKGRAFFCGKVGYYPVGKLASVIIKRKEDFMLAEFLIKALEQENIYEVKYYEKIEDEKAKK